MYSGLSNKFRQPAFIDRYLFRALCFYVAFCPLALCKGLVSYLASFESD